MLSIQLCSHPRSLEEGRVHAMHTLTHARTQRLHTIYTKSSCLLSLSWCNSSYAGCHHEAGHPRRRTKTSINAYFHITRHTCPKCTAGSEWSLIWTSAMKSDISTHQWCPSEQRCKSRSPTAAAARQPFFISSLYCGHAYIDPP